ncbi:hypothetical protein DIPPA_28401 [Diplonema papillatum]|nr:hypothetical protein DIPPA_28401 [Diplonema papillatum]
MLNLNPPRLQYLVDETSCHDTAQQRQGQDPVWLPLSSPCGAAVSAGTLLLDVALPVPERACRVFLTLPFDKNILPLCHDTAQRKGIENLVFTPCGAAVSAAAV